MSVQLGDLVDTLFSIIQDRNYKAIMRAFPGSHVSYLKFGVLYDTDEFGRPVRREYRMCETVPSSNSECANGLLSGQSRAITGCKEVDRAIT